MKRWKKFQNQSIVQVQFGFLSIQLTLNTLRMLVQSIRMTFIKYHIKRKHFVIKLNIQSKVIKIQTTTKQKKFQKNLISPEENDISIISMMLMTSLFPKNWKKKTENYLNQIGQNVKKMFRKVKTSWQKEFSSSFLLTLSETCFSLFIH